jgi:murein DD-endopeptidase MepM/ murein hydrolase activator NlpD
MKSLGLKLLTATASVSVLAACSAEPRYPIELGQPMGEGGVEVAQPRYPITQAAPPAAAQPSPPQPPPRPPAADDAPPRAAPTSRIESEPLAAPGSAKAASSRPYPSVSPSASGDYPPPPPSASDEEDLRGRQTAGPPPVKPPPMPALEVPRAVQVQPFETVYDVAERVRTPIRAIVELNNLRAPYTLTPGMMLRIPPPVIYTVAEGDNLFGVARRFSIDPRSLANLNDIPLETRLRAGQRLALPSLVHDGGQNPKARGAPPEGLLNAAAIAAATPSTQRTPYRSAGAGGSEPYRSAATASVAAASAAAETAAAREPLPPRPETPPVSESQVTDLGKGKFTWPVKGEILSTFGPKGAGQRNDGVNIAATTGDPVKAAAAGVVVYAGNSIPAFGNLVLVKHPGGWATLYGNLGKITVKNNAQIAQGEEVGTAGVSGAVDRPQVHFEIRYAQNPRDKAKPYDPASLLP